MYNYKFLKTSLENKNFSETYCRDSILPLEALATRYFPLNERWFLRQRVRIVSNQIMNSFE